MNSLHYAKSLIKTTKKHSESPRTDASHDIDFVLVLEQH